MNANALADAYATLGLDPSASHDDVRARFRVLVKERHPDAGGNAEDLSAVQNAYDAICTGTAPMGTALQVRLNGAAMVPLTAGEQRRERREDAQRVVRELVRHQTSPLVQAQRQGRWAAIIAGGGALVFAFASTLGIDRIETSTGGEHLWLPGEIRLPIAGLSGAVAGVLALITWKSNARATWIESALEDADDYLSDRNSYLQLLDEISAEGRLGSTWTQQTLVEAIYRWSDAAGSPPSRQLGLLGLLTFGFLGLLTASPRTDQVPLADLALVTGTKDFAKLLTVKGLERDLIVEQLVPIDERVEYRYSISLPELSSGGGVDVG
jgi:hypothetical protein